MSQGRGNSSCGRLKVWANIVGKKAARQVLRIRESGGKFWRQRAVQARRVGGCMARYRFCVRQCKSLASIHDVCKENACLSSGTTIKCFLNPVTLRI